MKQSPHGCVGLGGARAEVALTVYIRMSVREVAGAGDAEWGLERTSSSFPSRKRCPGKACHSNQEMWGFQRSETSPVTSQMCVYGGVTYISPGTQFLHL